MCGLAHEYGGPSLGMQAAIASRLLHLPAPFRNQKLRHLATKMVEKLIYDVLKPPVILFRDKNGLQYFLRPDDANLYEYAYYGSYHEIAEQEFCRRYVGEDMTAVDVGAQYGQYALLFSRLVGSGRVHAFEPSSFSFQRLQENLAVGAVDNVVASRMALFSRRCTTSLYVYQPSWNGCNSLARRRIVCDGREIQPIGRETVEAISLDEYADDNALERIHLLKIDVEGLELEVLRGADTLLSAGRIECLMVEVGVATEDHARRDGDALDYLTRYGYGLFCLREKGPLLAHYEITRPLQRTNLIAIRDPKLLKGELFEPYRSGIPTPPIEI